MADSDQPGAWLLKAFAMGWFMVVMRLYWPKEATLGGKRTAPQLQRVK